MQRSHFAPSRHMQDRVLDPEAKKTDLGPMATVIDTLTARNPEDRAARHPEKQNRPDTAVLRKPEWLRVRAPGAGAAALGAEAGRTRGASLACR
ncbi:MAG: hypothetical protein B7Z44_10250 [Caulobacter sp. 12-67-6]|nr:MAG: hypothetical protein B7Z44_10250 [Caulobacter sp. 12-67-6]